ncbi:uncharacterized protein LOC136766383 [Amia ocellicauda]|uniref:uncharacterized protein LOC136766383 n=1 Tax=Amia ocellicauda TaxID=2972642 RepID=UPI003464574D
MESRELKMDSNKRIFSLLQRHRLEKFYNGFLELGVEDEKDFKDSVTEQNLNYLGLSQMEKNRFENMLNYIQRLGNDTLDSTGFKKSMEVYSIKYRFPKSSEARIITDMDPSMNTVEDLMLRICHQEHVEHNKAVCLYSQEGMPLTDDPFFNTWSLNDRQIENGSEIYAIFTLKENLTSTVQGAKQIQIPDTGEDTVRCHIMLKGDYEVQVDLSKDTLKVLKQKLSRETGIPYTVLQARDSTWSNVANLESLGIKDDTVVHFFLSSFSMESDPSKKNFVSDVNPSVQQTRRGMSVFFSTLYVINMKHKGYQFQKVIAFIRKLSGCNALAQSLHQIMCRNEVISKVQKIAVVEGLYTLFRELLPSIAKRINNIRIIEDQEVFEHASLCWAYLISAAQTQSIDYEVYAPITLMCKGSGLHLCEPVRIPGIADVFERSYVMQKIADGEKIPSCSEKSLKAASVQRATDIERILLCVPPSQTTFPLWTSHNFIQGDDFQIQHEISFHEMCENRNTFPHLDVTPPLYLKSIGLEGPLLVLLEEDNLGVYLQKDKANPENVTVFDTLEGKDKNISVETLAYNLRDVRSDQIIRTTRMPKEAILVIMDSSSSMQDECYDKVTKMKRIDAVKQLFHAFANRSMAYDFKHVIGLMRVGGKATILHTFTETMETFKEYINSLKSSGNTPLYDGLDFGISELGKIKEQFPDCKLRILCLTDGQDVGSVSDPVNVAAKLISSNIVVDAIIVGTVENYVLHGITNVTGGCCFKPSTSKDALKIFEMETVLSLECRKVKKKYEASSIQRLTDLTSVFTSHGYDDKPDIKRPEEVNEKVALTHVALKKKIKECKTGKVMEKDKRILEELKNLHCSPHPYCKVFPSETDITFWQILMLGPPDTPYENGTFLLYCKFGEEYPIKPPLVRFITTIYHCNVNSVGRICHNIFDRNYSAHVTMRNILEAVYGLLIAPEPDDPLDSILAEEYQSSRGKYLEEAKNSTTTHASTSLEDMEKTLLGMDLKDEPGPSHLICRLTGKMFIDPVETPSGNVYERRAIENHLKTKATDPSNNKPLHQAELKSSLDMKKMVETYRKRQIQETAV